MMEMAELTLPLAGTPALQVNRKTDTLSLFVILPTPLFLSVGHYEDADGLQTRNEEARALVEEVPRLSVAVSSARPEEATNCSGASEGKARSELFRKRRDGGMERETRSAKENRKKRRRQERKQRERGRENFSYSSSSLLS